MGLRYEWSEGRSSTMTVTLTNWRGRSVSAIGESVMMKNRRDRRVTFKKVFKGDDVKID